MNWLHWWVPQFVFLFFLLIFLAPNLGSFFLKELRCKIDSKLWLGNLEFLIGFCLVYLLASFLLPLHRAGIVILVLFLIYLKFSKKYASAFRLSFSDLIVVPVTIATLFYPAAIDHNLRLLQFSTFHDLWPLDWGPRLDVHNSLAVLLSYWFKNVPLINALPVQATFLGLMVWRGLILCWEMIQKYKIKFYEEFFLAIIFMGSLYYRKQIETKASPVGGFFAVLCFIMLSMEISPIVMGFFAAASFSFGEYGGILIAGMAPMLIAQGGAIRRRFISALPWSILFGAPEVCRKIFTATSGSFTALIAAGVLCVVVYLLREGISDFLKKLPEFKKTPIILLVFSFLGTIIVTLYFPMPRFDSNAATLWHWSLGCNGILFLVSAYYVWKNRKTDLSQILMSFASLQLIFLSLWHLSDYFSFPTVLNPSFVWWNMGKNAMMITWPLLTTFLGAIFFTGFFNGKKNEKYFIIGAALAIYFIFLQDPLVHQVKHGPFAPHSPRFSVYRNIYEMYWQTVHAPRVSSKSGNLVLAHSALPEGDLAEAVFQKQKQSSEMIDVCFDPAAFPNYDISAYTLGYFSGVNGVAGYSKCKIFLKPQNEACSFGTNTIFEGKMARLCEK